MSKSGKIRYIDLFCGLGAFHTAFNISDQFECVLASDINQGIQKIYKENYGLAPQGDIKDIKTDKIPDFDVLCAGFPCQPFSIAGNKEGFQDKEKGNLFYEILRIIDAKQPPMCILENVKNLHTHDDGNTFKTIEKELRDRSYTVTSKVLNAVDFGSPQARQRIFIIATKKLPFTIPSGNGVVRPVSTIIDTSVVKDDINRKKYALVAKTAREIHICKPKIIYDVTSIATKRGGRQGERVYDIQNVGITLCASSGGPGAKTGLYKVGDTIRRLSIKEALGMFGFPMTYKYSGIENEEMLFYLGNSIVVNVVQAFVKPVETWFMASRK